MKTNKELLNSKREFLKSTSLVSLPNIVLDPEEADAFIDLCVDQSYFLKNVRVEKMKRNEKQIRYMDFSSSKRFLIPDGSFTSTGYTKTLAEGKVTLTARKARGCIVIADDDLEDNPEGAAFGSHIMNLVSKQVANELDEALYVSNTSSTNFPSGDLRHDFNGWRYDLLSFATSSGALPTAAHELDASSTSDFNMAGDICENTTGAGNPLEVKFKGMIDTLPTKFTRDYNNLRFYTNPKVMSDYSQALQNRATPLGDKAIIGEAPTSFAGIPIITVPLMPSTYATGSAGTESFADTADGTYKYSDVLLTPKDNLIFGIHRSLRLETERSAADEMTYGFYSIRFCTHIMNPDAAVILHDLTHS